MCTVRTRAQSSGVGENTMTEKKCAHPQCKCAVAEGKEFCSDECRNARTGGAACPCDHQGCQTS